MAEFGPENLPNLDLATAEEHRRIDRAICDLWRRFGAGYSNLREFAEAHGEAGGFDYDMLNRKRTRKEFKARMDAIAEKFNPTSAKATEAARFYDLAKARWPDLDRWKGIWLEKYRETCDRGEASDMVDKTISEVTEEIKQDAKFFEGWEKVQGEFLARAEDQRWRLALAGKGGLEVIETQSNDLSKIRTRKNLKETSNVKSFTDYNRDDTRSEAKLLFRSLLRSPKPEVTDVENEQGSTLAAS